jgi:hypothetical protein
VHISPPSLIRTAVGEKLHVTVGLHHAPRAELIIPQYSTKRLLHPNATQRTLLAPTMFFRFKLLALVVLASTAIVSVQAHNGEHEHGNGVAMSVTGGSGTTIFSGENQPPTADSELEGQADDGETRSYKRDWNPRSADIELDEASEGAESESLRESDSVPRAADSELEDESDDGVEGESRSRKRDSRNTRRNLRVQLA